MTVITTTDCPFPPQGHQIRLGQGTLTSVVVPLTNNIAGTHPEQGSINTGSASMKASFYDSASGATGTPLVSIDSTNGYVPVTLNLPFTKGLFVVQQSGSSIQVTTA